MLARHGTRSKPRPSCAVIDSLFQHLPQRPGTMPYVALRSARPGRQPFANLCSERCALSTDRNTLVCPAYVPSCHRSSDTLRSSDYLDPESTSTEDGAESRPNCIRPPTAARAPRGVCGKRLGECHTLGCPDHGPVREVHRRQELVRRAVEPRTVPLAFRVSIRAGETPKAVHEAVKSLRGKLARLMAYGDETYVRIAFTVEPNANPNRQHLHGLLLVESLDLLAGDTTAAKLSALTAAIAKGWRLQPETPRDSAVLAEALAHVDALPGGHYGHQTREQAVGYFLHYVVKRWRDPNTRDDHVLRNGGNHQSFRHVGLPGLDGR